MEHRVMGLDLACSQSGIALPDGTTLVIKEPKIKPSGRKRTLTDDMDRLEVIRSSVRKLLYGSKPRLVVVEDYARSLQSAAAHRLAEVGGVVRLECHDAGARIVVCNVMHLKIYATGKGNATKSEMAVSALKRVGVTFDTEDECDAWWLRAMGLDLLGSPILDLPERNRSAVAKLTGELDR
jgi:Holliday junction resolvasome RuvABC endonuclease subunit